VTAGRAPSGEPGDRTLAWEPNGAPDRTPAGEPNPEPDRTPNPEPDDRTPNPEPDGDDGAGRGIPPVGRGGPGARGADGRGAGGRGAAGPVEGRWLGGIPGDEPVGAPPGRALAGGA
jgi:hypothetical protein